MTSYPEHLQTFDYVGRYRYFLTFCTFERRLYFKDSAVVELVREQFLRAASECHFAVIVYCFMPDHVHVLVEGLNEGADLKQFAKLAKQYSGYYFKQRTRASLWQRYGYERVLRNEESTPDVVRYTIANPVRGGLATRPSEYPFWGSSVYTREELLEYIGRAA